MSEGVALHSLATVCSTEGVCQDHTASAALASIVLLVHLIRVQLRQAAVITQQTTNSGDTRRP